MTPEELKILDSAIKIGLGGLIGIITSAIGGVIAYKIAIANSKAKLKEKHHENNELLLKECMLHINHYHSNLSQFLYYVEQIDLLEKEEEPRLEMIAEQETGIEKIGKLLFEVGNTEVDLASAKLLFMGLDKAYALTIKYDNHINEFYLACDFSPEKIMQFRSETTNNFRSLVKEIANFRKGLL